jgi:hypothetical protein
MFSDVIWRSPTTPARRATRLIHESAGLIASAERECWTVQSGKTALLTLASRLGKKTLVVSDIEAGSAEGVCPGLEWAKEKLAPKTGKMAEVIETLGLEQRGWTVASASEALRKLAQRLGRRTVTARDLDAHGKGGVCPSAHWVVKNLAPMTGKWDEAMRTAGMEPYRWTVKSGKAALVALAKRLGKSTLSQADIHKGSVAGECPSAAWVARRLAPKTGTLAEVMAQLGLQTNGWTVETGSDALRSLIRRLGRTPF